MKQSFKDFIVAAKTFVKDAYFQHENELAPSHWLYLNEKEYFKTLPKEILTEVSQAMITEENLQSFQARDWRTYFSNKLSGKGLEIGPLHRPMVRHPGMEIDYIDRCTVAELREHYPELNNLPLVEPHIIGDAQTLEGVPNKSYDFVIAAHVIEHMKNPLGALEAWCRVTRPGGKVYLIVPDKRVIFDKHRLRTTLEHIILDYREPSAERDFEHYHEYGMFVHDKKEEEALEEAERLIRTDYSIHFHVFLPTDIINLLRWFSENVSKISILEGPTTSPGSDEFHLLLEVQ